MHYAAARYGEAGHGWEVRGSGVTSCPPGQSPEQRRQDSLHVHQDWHQVLKNHGAKSTIL